MPFSPYDLYQQDPRYQVFGQSGMGSNQGSPQFDDSEQRQRLVDLLRNQPQQAQSSGGASLPAGSSELLGAIGNKIGDMNWKGSGQMTEGNVNSMNNYLSSGFQNAGQFNQMTPQQSAITPNMQSLQGAYQQDPGILAKYFGGFGG